MFTLVKPVCAQDWTGACVGTGAGTDVATIRGIECVITNLLRYIPNALALVAAFMIVLAGVKVISAGADPKAYAAAWQQLTWAVIGLILLAGVWLILVFIERFTGAPVTQFCIPQ